YVFCRALLCSRLPRCSHCSFNLSAAPLISTLSLHDALPICLVLIIFFGQGLPFSYHLMSSGFDEQQILHSVQNEEKQPISHYFYWHGLTLPLSFPLPLIQQTKAYKMHDLTSPSQ